MAELKLDERVRLAIARVVLDHDRTRLVDPTTRDEPPRRLGEGPDESHHDCRSNNLEQKRPRPGAIHRLRADHDTSRGDGSDEVATCQDKYSAKFLKDNASGMKKVAALTVVRTTLVLLPYGQSQRHSTGHPIFPSTPIRSSVAASMSSINMRA